MDLSFRPTGWDVCSPSSRFSAGHGRPVNHGRGRGNPRCDRRCPGLRAWARRERANPRSPHDVIGLDPASDGNDDGWPPSRPVFFFFFFFFICLKDMQNEDQYS